MTVEVVYTQNGEEKSVEFDFEQEASIFMDGLNSRDSDDRNNAHFEEVNYPEKDER